MGGWNSFTQCTISLFVIFKTTCKTHCILKTYCMHGSIYSDKNSFYLSSIILHHITKNADMTLYLIRIIRMKLPLKMVQGTFLYRNCGAKWHVKKKISNAKMSINKTGVTILLLGKVPLPGLHIEAHIYSYAPQQRLVSHPALGGNGKSKEKKQLKTAAYTAFW